MFMSYIGSFSSSVGRKEDKYVILELIYEFCISYQPYKRNIMFMRLLAPVVFNDSCGVQNRL